MGVNFYIFCFASYFDISSETITVTPTYFNREVSHFEHVNNTLLTSIIILNQIIPTKHQDRKHKYLWLK